MTFHKFRISLNKHLPSDAAAEASLLEVDGLKIDQNGNYIANSSICFNVKLPTHFLVKNVTARVGEQSLPVIQYWNTPGAICVKFKSKAVANYYILEISDGQYTYKTKPIRLQTTGHIKIIAFNPCYLIVNEPSEIWITGYFPPNNQFWLRFSGGLFNKEFLVYKQSSKLLSFRLENIFTTVPLSNPQVVQMTLVYLEPGENAITTLDVGVIKCFTVAQKTVNHSLAPGQSYGEQLDELYYNGIVHNTSLSKHYGDELPSNEFIAQLTDQNMQFYQHSATKNYVSDTDYHVQQIGEFANNMNSTPEKEYSSEGDIMNDFEGFNDTQ